MRLGCDNRMSVSLHRDGQETDDGCSLRNDQGWLHARDDSANRAVRISPINHARQHATETDDTASVEASSGGWALSCARVFTPDLRSGGTPRSQTQGEPETHR